MDGKVVAPRFSSRAKVLRNPAEGAPDVDVGPRVSEGWRADGVVVTLALHRIRSLEVSIDVARSLPVFDADTYVGSLFGVHGSGAITHYRLRFAPAVASYIRERQWHPTQQLRARPDGALTLAFECQESFAVTAWIASWRHHVTMLAPGWVRRELRELGQELQRRYA